MAGMGVVSPSRSAEATRSSSPPFVPWRASWWEGRLPRSAKIWAAFGAPWQVTVNCDGLDQKGAIHLALAAIINSVLDLWANAEGKPVWQMLADMEPERLVRCLDFRFVMDALTPAEAIAILRNGREGRSLREAGLRERGYPAYTIGPGWLGYSEEKMRRFSTDAVPQGFSAIKQKVGDNIAEDQRRASILRDAIGPDRHLMMDANQVWEVDEAIASMRQLAEFNPYWIEEPTSPDEILGCARIREAIRPILVATGEPCQNRIMFKQMLQAGAIDVCQLDVARLGGLNEAVLVVLVAEKFGIPICPH